MKTLEIYYNISDIPDIADRGPFSGDALSFRNDAMHFIEEALLRANVGEWVGAEIGEHEVNFGFDVEDFETAINAVREAVAGTRYENIREIEQNEISEEELMEMAAEHEEYAHVKPMSFFEIVGMLIFRRMPKRFRQL